MNDELPIYPVFGFLLSEPGTTLLHGSLEFEYENPRNFTLCGINCTGWYGDDDLTLDDVECKTCRRIIEKMRKEMTK